MLSVLRAGTLVSVLARTRALSIISAELEEKERTFEAFTKHSRELIEKERFMNKRLRAYSLQMDPKK